MCLGGMTPYPVISALNHFGEDFGLGVNEKRVSLNRDKLASWMILNVVL